MEVTSSPTGWGLRSSYLMEKVLKKFFHRLHPQLSYCSRYVMFMRSVAQLLAFIGSESDQWI